MSDYGCGYNPYDNIAAFEKEVDFDIKSALFQAEPMVRLAKFIKDKNGEAFCKLPFDHVLEGESLGGRIIFDEKRLEFRRGAGICENLDEALQLPEIDFSKGRIAQVLEAARLLIEQGEEVVLNVSGPITVLNGFMETELLFYLWRKDSAKMQQLIEKIQQELFRYIQAARSYGVTMFSYGDPLGGADVIGPKLAKEVGMNHVFTWIEAVLHEIGDCGMLLLCPKLARLFIQCDVIKERDVRLKTAMSYQEACMELKGRCRLTGMACVNSNPQIWENGVFQELVKSGE